MLPGPARFRDVDTTRPVAAMHTLPEQICLSAIHWERGTHYAVALEVKNGNKTRDDDAGDDGGRGERIRPRSSVADTRLGHAFSAVPRPLISPLAQFTALDEYHNRSRHIRRLGLAGRKKSLVAAAQLALWSAKLVQCR
jgi:hypothetical protein